MNPINTVSKIYHLTTPEELSTLLDSELTKLYFKCFAEPPSNQDNSVDKIKAMFSRHYESGGLILVANQDNRTVGFCATVPFPKSSLFSAEAVTATNQTVISDDNFCRQHLNIEAGAAWYLADIGTDSEYRGQGIATELFKTTLSLLPAGTPIFLRVTQAKTNAIRLYQSWGFKLLGLSQYPLYKKLSGQMEVESKFIMLYENKK
ncbi:GNAT family N-acetyltransferase [Ancylothrix sp. C2]|uniref:GNAT family N-acetyltransferase n=1 Tax=Ancylothrix sp. D3o TaxID=2953691 RepID=UPI0021BB60A8|nr:GNAT family N-acetyltransferase [Ancylothrix sp. D3o]MCT7952961.1 GNAT family N-acetyltransferase [Ancylothrix sp. D3o]